MKPLQILGEDTVLLCMLLKLIQHLRMLFVYWFVANSHEIDVSLVSGATPLVNGVLDLENQ